MRINLNDSTFLSNTLIYYLYILYFAISQDFSVLRNSGKSSLVMVSVHVDVDIPELIVIVIPDEPIPRVKCYQNYPHRPRPARPGMLTTRVSVSTELVGLKVAH